jgi:hypothetical protein
MLMPANNLGIATDALDFAMIQLNYACAHGKCGEPVGDH